MRFFHTIDRLSPESKLQQVSSSLQDPSDYSWIYKLIYCLGGLDSSSDYQLLQTPYHVFGNHSERTYVLQLSPQSPSCSKSFFSSWASLRYMSVFLVFFDFQSLIYKDGKVWYSPNLLFLLTIIKSGLLTGLKWSICISKSQRILFVSFSRMDYVLWLNHWEESLNFNFLQWISFLTQSCRLLLSFCANFPLCVSLR